MKKVKGKFFSPAVLCWTLPVLALLLPGFFFIFSTPFPPPEGVRKEPVCTPEEMKIRAMLEHGEYALLGDVSKLLEIVYYYLDNGKDDNAERWLEYASFRLKDPSMQLFYGDFLRDRGRKQEAENFYRLALIQGRAAGKRAEKFTREVEKRLNIPVETGGDFHEK